MAQPQADVNTAICSDMQPPVCRWTVWKSPHSGWNVEAPEGMCYQVRSELGSWRAAMDYVYRQIALNGRFDPYGATAG